MEGYLSTCSLCLFPVGAGTAGCVLASRLSEDPSVTVLVLEAGDEETKYPAVDVPLRAGENYGSEADWKFKSAPQTHACQGIKNKVKREILFTCDI